MTSKTYLGECGKNSLAKAGYGMRIVECLDLQAKMNGLGVILTAGHCTP